MQSRIVVPSRDERADDVPDLVAGARVEARRRLVEEHQLRRDDDARGDVEPAPHAPGVVLDQPAGRVGETERLEQLGRPRLGLVPLQAQQPAEQDEVLAPGQVLVDRGELARQADGAAHRIGLAHDVVAEHARLAAVRAQQRREHPDRRGLAGAVRAEHAVDGAAAHGQVDAVDGPDRAEDLDEAGGLDGEIGLRCHLAPRMRLLIAPASAMSALCSTM